MIPSRHSEGGSRRSSILKPPKQRQPLQCVVIHPSSSSSQSSPIIKKVKRRVSFAEKKHVKEFCDSFEQGTVWDNTYEENDSSHQKAIHSGNLDEGSTISKDTNPILPSSINSLDKENFPLDIQIFKDQSQLNPHSEITPITPFFDDLEPNIQNEVLESSAMDTDFHLPDVLIHTNEMQNFNNRPSEEIPSQEKNYCYNPFFAEENISTNISKSPLQNTINDNETMAFTKILPSLPQNDKENSYGHPSAKEQTERALHILSMDFTEAVPNTWFSETREREDQDGMDLTLGSENQVKNPTDETQLNDISMEMTTAIPSVRAQTSDDDNNKITRRNLSMEMTSVVPLIPISSQGNLVQIERDERTTLLRNSMELTAAVPSCYAQDTLQSVRLNTTGVLSRQRSMEFTSVVSSILPSENQENFQKRTAETDRDKSMEFTTIVPSCFPEENIQSKDLEDKSVRLFSYKSMEFKTIPSSLPERSSFNSPDSSIAEKKIRLSTPGDLTETKSLILENQSNFENCSHVGVEQRLRRSDGIDLLNMELTEPLLPTLVIKTFGESILRPSSVAQNFISDSQEKSLTADASLSQICMPPLSSNLSLEKSVDLKEVGRSRSKSFELNSVEDMSKEVFNLSERIQIVEESKDEAKEVEEGNEDVDNENSLSGIAFLVDLSKSEERLKNFYPNLSSKRIENEEPPSFLLNLSTSDENSLEEFNTKDQEALENQNEDLAETLKIRSKRSFETSGICEIENQVETSMKRRSIENTELPQQIIEMRSRRTFVVSQEKTTQLDNSVETKESSETLFEGEKLKETELSIFEIEKEVKSQDLGDEIKKRGKKRNSGGKSIHVSENSITSTENVKKGQDRRYTFVINKEMNLNSQNVIQIEEAVIEENSNEKKNPSFGETITIKKNVSIKYCQVEELVNDVETPIVEKQNDSSIIKDPFSTLLDDIRSYAERDDCIWNIRFLNEKILVLNFISKSLLVIIELCSQNDASLRDIKDIKIKSLLPGETQHLIRIVHDLILQKLHPDILLESHKLYEDVLPLLEQISKEVKLALDFMFELQQLKDLNLMEIDSKRISFLTRTKRMDIILEITLNIKPFEEINSDHVNVKCLLGSISINEVKQLIINVKKDHKFLRRFMNDVRDYVELMEESAAAGRKVGS